MHQQKWRKEEEERERQREKKRKIYSNNRLDSVPIPVERKFMYGNLIKNKYKKESSLEAFNFFLVVVVVIRNDKKETYSTNCELG